MTTTDQPPPKTHMLDINEPKVLDPKSRRPRPSTTAPPPSIPLPELPIPLPQTQHAQLQSPPPSSSLTRRFAFGIPSLPSLRSTFARQDPWDRARYPVEMDRDPIERRLRFHALCEQEAAAEATAAAAAAEAAATATASALSKTPTSSRKAGRQRPRKDSGSDSRDSSIVVDSMRACHRTSVSPGARFDRRVTDNYGHENWPTHPNFDTVPTRAVNSVAPHVRYGEQQHQQRTTSKRTGSEPDWSILHKVSER